MSEIQKKATKALAAKPLARKEIFAALGMSGDSRSFKRHLEPLLSEGLIEMTVPDNPKSKLQKYRLSESGRAVLARIFS